MLTDFSGLAEYREWIQQDEEIELHPAGGDSFILLSGFVLELLCRDINEHLDSTDIDPVQHRPITMKYTTRRDTRKRECDPRKW